MCGIVYCATDFIANIMHLEATDEFELSQCPDTLEQTVIWLWVCISKAVIPMFYGRDAVLLYRTLGSSYTEF